MSAEWYQGIEDACRYWHEANMLQHTFNALKSGIETKSDVTIDASKGIVECLCRIIIDELDDPTKPLKPDREDVPITEWVATATRLLKLSDIRNRKFADLIKHHNKIADSLRVLRNDAGPVSHGKDGFINSLSIYHHRSAVLAADALVTFLHQAYTEVEPNLMRTHEPYDRFSKSNALIDKTVLVTSEQDDEGFFILKVRLPTGDVFDLPSEPSRLLFYLDREAYVEALGLAKSALGGSNVKSGEV
jgi:hypothetical protein